MKDRINDIDIPIFNTEMELTNFLTNQTKLPEYVNKDAIEIWVSMYIEETKSIDIIGFLNWMRNHQLIQW